MQKMNQFYARLAAGQARNQAVFSTAQPAGTMSNSLYAQKWCVERLAMMPLDVKADAV
jgi:hypothetical protein